jgi:hypothetical protein
MKPRSAKTEFLIRKSAHMGATIVCYSEKSKQLVKQTAKKLNIVIPDPVTANDLWYPYQKAEYITVDEASLFKGG